MKSKWKAIGLTCVGLLSCLVFPYKIKQSKGVVLPTVVEEDVTTNSEWDNPTDMEQITQSVTTERASTYDLSQATITLDHDTSTYNYQAKNVGVTVTASDGTVLTEGVDYEIKYYMHNCYVRGSYMSYVEAPSIFHAGKYTIQAEAKGSNISGTISTTYIVKRRSISNVYTNETTAEVGEDYYPHMIDRETGEKLYGDSEFVRIWVDTYNVGQYTVDVVAYTNSEDDFSKVYSYNGGYDMYKDADYYGTYTYTVTVVPMDLNNSQISGWEYYYLANNVYTGYPLTDLRFNYDEYPDGILLNGAIMFQLLENVDFTITFPEDMTSVGDKVITFTGIGNCTGTKTITLTIEPRELASMTIDHNTSRYDHTEKQVQVTAYASDGTELTLGQDYHIRYYMHNVKLDFDSFDKIEVPSILHAGRYTIEAYNSKGSVTAEYIVKRRSLEYAYLPEENANIFLSGCRWFNLKDRVTGVTISPDMGIQNMYDYAYQLGTYTMEVRSLAPNDDDFSKPYAGYTNEIMDTDYYGSVEVTYHVVPIPLDRFKGWEGFYLVDNTYTGSPLTNLQYDYDINVDGVMFWDGAYYQLTKDDYTITFPEDMTSVGEKQVIFTGIGNCTGTKTLTFTIQPRPLTSSILTWIGDASARQDWTYSYTGKPIEVDFCYAYNGMPLIIGQDVILQYTDNTSMNETGARVTISGIGNYTGSFAKMMKIVRRNINDTIVTIHPIADQTYNRKEIEPQLTIYNDDILLVQGVDYELSYANNINVGLATVTITGIGNYTGTKEVTFAIVPAQLQRLSVSWVDVHSYYTGSPKEYTTLVVAGVRLTADEYKITYSREDMNVNDPLFFIQAGKITFTATATSPNFTGSVTYEASIEKAMLSTPTLNMREHVYTGSNLTPTIVSIEKYPEVLALQEGRDYTVRYLKRVSNGWEVVSQIIDAGEYSIEIRPNPTNYVAEGDPDWDDDWAEELRATFIVLPKDITEEDVVIKYYYVNQLGQLLDELGHPSDKKVYMTSNQIFLGQLVTAEITYLVDDNTSLLLQKSRDYTEQFVIEVGTPTTVGEFSIPVTAKGNYTGAITKKYQINPRPFESESIRIEIAGEYTYTGSPITIDPSNLTVINTANNMLLTLGVDYDLYVGEVEFKGIDDVTTTTVTLDTPYLFNTNAGEAYIFLVGKGTYTTEIMWQEFMIQPKQLDDSFTLELDNIRRVFSGKQYRPTLAGAVWKGMDLVYGEDYTLSYEENIHAGNAIVTVKGINNYTGDYDIQFTIDPKVISDADVRLVSTERTTYNRQEQHPSINLVYTFMNLEMPTDYTVTYYRNNRVDNDVTSAGEITVLLQGVGDYTGHRTFTYTIERKALSSIALNVDTFVYNRYAQTPDVTIYDGSVELVIGQEYTLSYYRLVAGNYEPISMGDIIGIGEYRVIATGIGNYKDTLTADFTITPRAITEDMIEVDLTDKYYQVLEICPSVVVSYDGIQLIQDSEVRVVYTKNINAGTAIITITGTGNYDGSITKTFTILPRDFAEVELTQQDVTLTYNKFNQSLSNEQCNSLLTYLTYHLYKGVDFTIEYEDEERISVGEYAFTLRGIGNYTGQLSYTFHITPKELTSGVTIQDIDSMEYTGSEIVPNIIVTDGPTLLIENVDYTLTITDNINVGIAHVTITGKGNYTGTLSSTFTIGSYSIEEGTAYGVEATYVYTGVTITPTVTVTVQDTQLIVDQDYTVQYDSDVTNIGTKHIYIKGMGNYAGSMTVSYEIVSKNISDNDIILSDIDNIMYTGKELQLELQLSYQGISLIENTDYRVEYTDNIAVGTAHAEVIGLGNYTGSVVFDFEIVPGYPRVRPIIPEGPHFAGQPVPSITLGEGSTEGTITIVEPTILLGEHVYHYLFTSSDPNYMDFEGTITLIGVQPEVVQLSLEGDYKTSYLAYETLDLTGLVVKATFNTGEVRTLTTSEYTLSIATGTVLTIDSVVTISVGKMTATLPITIRPREVSVIFEANNLLEGRQNTVTYRLEGQLELYPVQSSIVYTNAEGQVVTSLSMAGKYTATVTTENDNYVLTNHTVSIYVKPTAISSTNSDATQVRVVSATGWAENVSVTIKKVTEKQDLVAVLGENAFNSVKSILFAYEITFYKDGQVYVPTEEYTVSVFGGNNQNSHKDYYILRNGALTKVDAITENDWVSIGKGNYTVIVCTGAKEDLTGYIILAIIGGVLLLSFVGTAIYYGIKRHKRRNSLLG